MSEASEYLYIIRRKRWVGKKERREKNDKRKKSEIRNVEGNKKRKGKERGKREERKKATVPSFNTSSYSKRADGVILATSVSAETYTCAQTYLLT